jgi:energy-converting hydrogenase Eha subunit F
MRNTFPVILHPLQSPGEFLRHPQNLVTVEHFSSPILFATGIHFPFVLLHNQGYPKVCPDPLNLLNAGDSFAGISSLSSCSLLSPTRDLVALKFSKTFFISNQ